MPEESGPDRRLSDKDLLDFLRVVGESLKRRIVLVAVGGTALTLLKVKASTRDVDFTGPRDDILEFRSAEDETPHGLKVDTYFDGTVFEISLPPDYMERSPIQETDLERIELRTLHPADLVVTKVSRFDDRDRRDIRDAVRKLNIGAVEVEHRARSVGIAGNEANFDYNLGLLLRAMREEPPFQGPLWQG